MDSGTCEACNALDGVEFPYQSAERTRTEPPYSECDGMDRCRCLHVYVFEEERPGQPGEPVLPQVPEVVVPERGHRVPGEGDPVDLLVEDARLRGIDLTRVEANDILEKVTQNTYKSSDASLSQIRGAPNSQAVAVERYIDVSPRYPQEQLLYRGVRVSDDTTRALKDTLMGIEPGHTLEFKATTHWSSQASVPHAFSEEGGIVFRLTGGAQRSASVKHISSYASEDEVLGGMGLRLRVVAKPTIRPLGPGDTLQRFVVDVEEVR
jgi:hypothetical protein